LLEEQKPDIGSKQNQIKDQLKEAVPEDLLEIIEEE